MTDPRQSPLGRKSALQRLRALGGVAGLLLFFGAVYLSGRLGVEMARNRLPDRGEESAFPANEALTVGKSGDPLYLANSPEALRRFFTAHPTPEERAAADLFGRGIRRLQDAVELTALRAEADAVEVEVNSGAIAGAVYWIHHSQLPAPSSFDPIISPLPEGSTKSSGENGDR